MLTSEENIAEGENISLQKEMYVWRYMLQILWPYRSLILFHAYKLAEEKDTIEGGNIKILLLEEEKQKEVQVRR
jgi:hypothetical protein